VNKKKGNNIVFVCLFVFSFKFMPILSGGVQLGFCYAKVEIMYLAADANSFFAVSGII